MFLVSYFVFRVWVPGVGLRVPDSGFRVSGSRFQVPYSGSRLPNLWVQISGGGLEPRRTSMRSRFAPSGPRNASAMTLTDVGGFVGEGGEKQW
jgi:hypothetical protein